MVRKLLAFFGYKIQYVHEWGVWDHRYDAIDLAMSRPIHRQMSVAPPSAKMRIVRLAEKVKP